MSDAALELRQVTKLFGGFRAVDALDLTVPRGCVYGFLGPNGAGKTTTLRILLEILKPTSGQVTVLGTPSALRVRHRLGYLPEEKGLYKKMRTWSIIAYFATLKGLTRRAAKRRAYELLEQYGLKDFAEARTEALSKGMGQKVQVLAAIAHDPELVILDEPFAGLDPVNQQVMEEIIHDLAGRGRTVLFSTHVMQHAERLCDRMVIIAKGRKRFDGTLGEAKRTLPRRVRLETRDDPAPLREVPAVASLIETPASSAAAAGFPAGAATARPVRVCEVELREGADAQAVLQACFGRGLRLEGFHYAEPTLHEVFVHLVGAEAREASFR